MGSSGSARFWIWIFTGVLTVVLGVVLNLALGDVKTQIDLTEDQRFTLPPAAADIAASLEDTLKCTVYLSENLPSVIEFVDRVLRTRLEEFHKASDGKFVFEFVVPERDKAVVDELAKRTPPIQPVGAQDMKEGKMITGQYFLTLVFRYGDQEAVYNLIEMQQAIRQEADFSKMLPFQIAAKIVKLKNPDKKVGIASDKKPVPKEMQGQQQQSEPTDGLAALRETITRHLPKPEDVSLKNAVPIRDDIDTLIVHRPEDLDERAVYELDQFLMKGKRILLLLDNLSLFDIDRVQDYVSSFLQPARSQGDTSTLKVREVKHGLKDWLAHYGVIAGEGYLEDRTNAKSVRNVPVMDILPDGRPSGRIRINQQTTDLPGFILVPERGEDKKPSGQFNESSPALAGLGKVTMAYPVPLSLDRDAVAKHGKVEAEELLRTSRESWVRKVEDGKVKLYYPPDAAPPDKGEWGSRPLAISLHGQFKSAFADKTYGEADRPPRKGPDGNPLPEGPNPPAKLAESAAPGQLWIFADSDFVSDWSLGSQAFQATVPATLSAQGAIQGMAMMMVGLVNILDTITVGDELVEIRRPNIVDRSVDQVAVDKEAAAIKFRTVALGPSILVAVGILWWLVRTAMTRVPSPSGFTKSAAVAPPSGGAGRHGRTGLDEPAPVGAPSGDGAEEVRS